MPQRGQRRPGIVDLVRAGQVRQGQVQEPRLILKDQPPAIGKRVPVLPMAQQGHPQPRRPRLDHRQPVRALRTDDTRHAPLQNPRLLPGDLGNRVTQILLMIQRHRRDHRQARHLDHVRGIEPPAQPHLQQRPIRRHPRKGQKRCTGRDLEERDLVRPVRGHTLIEQRRQRVLADQRACQPDPLVKPRQMRRGIGVRSGPRRLQPRPDHRQRRSLTVGPRDMDDRRQPVFRMAQRSQQPMHPAQGQVDDLGVQGHHPVQNGVGTHAGTTTAGTGSGAGRSPLIAGPCPVSSRRMVTNSSFNCLRCVTRSSIP